MTEEERLAARIENLNIARDNLASVLATISANPRPSYTLDLQTFSWEEYFEMLTRQLEALDKAVQRLTKRPNIKWLGRCGNVDSC